jgi:hypothetical protein
MSLIRRFPLSPKELQARRANARKSTGPRTLEGKARVSLNRLQHGLRSAGLEAFLRQRRIDSQAILALRKIIRLPGEQVDPLQAALVKFWLKSPVAGVSLNGAAGLRTVIDGSHVRTRRQTVGSLLSTRKMASVMKALSPDCRQILAAMVFESVLRNPKGNLAAPRSKRVCHGESIS